jgi:hypothetical protein
MPTFIDESGDVGFEPDSARYFRLAAVWVPSSDAAAAFRNTVRELRLRHHLPNDYEFKYFSTRKIPIVCEEFFRMALGQSFRFSVCCIDKTAEQSLITNRRAIHYLSSMSIATAMRHVYVGDHRHNEPVTVDDNGDSTFLATITHAFRGIQSGGRPLVGHPRFKDSKSDELLQLADMTCGAVGQHVERYPCDNQDEPCWYEIIKSAGIGVCCGWGPGVNCLS